MVLATQNPVDLDYKGLSNTGTWFIGRLQTERDKARVLEGMEGAAADSGQQYDRKQMEKILSSLGNRVFLMNNVHEKAPEMFQTRWTLSYLSGPLTRAQIKTLMEPVKRGVESSRITRHPSPDARATNDESRMTASRPMLPPDVPQQFVPIRSTQPSETRLIYVPMLMGVAQVRFADTKSGVDVTENVAMLAPISDGAVPVDWDHASMVTIAVDDLEPGPAKDSQFGPFPGIAGKGKSYEAWKQDFSGWLYRTQKVQLCRSSIAKDVSQPGESERDFRVRLQQAGRERRDKDADALRQKYAPKIAALEDRIRRAHQMVERQTAESRSSQLQAAISVGATILGAFLGRKAISATNIGKATTAIRGAGRAMKESKDVSQAEDNAAALQEQLTNLESQFKTEADALAAETDPLTEKLETVALKPSKSNISIKLVTLAWTPYWQGKDNTSSPAWQ